MKPAPTIATRLSSRITASGRFEVTRLIASSLLEEEAHQLSVERLMGGDQDPEGTSGRLPSRSPVQTLHRCTTSIIDARHLRPSAGGRESIIAPARAAAVYRCVRRISNGHRRGVAWRGGRPSPPSPPDRSDPY